MAKKKTAIVKKRVFAKSDDIEIGPFKARIITDKLAKKINGEKVYDIPKDSNEGGEGQVYNLHQALILEGPFVSDKPVMCNRTIVNIDGEIKESIEKDTEVQLYGRIGISTQEDTLGEEVFWFEVASGLASLTQAELSAMWKASGADLSHPAEEDDEDLAKAIAKKEKKRLKKLKKANKTA